MPRVSVIVPAHDASEVLHETLASIAAQSFTDYEVVVADDASTDETASRAEAAGVRVVRSPVNLGPAGARNLALREASGEIVAFLDADDLWRPDYLERQLARYGEESQRSHLPPVGIVACDASIRTHQGFLPFTYMEQFRRVEPLTLERVLQRDCIFISSLVPRSVGELVGWFDPDLFGTEDHDLWIRVLETGHRAVLNREVLAVYRRAPGSVSSNIARQGVNNQKTYRRALARGKLPPRAQRIARRELTYNRAMTAAARVWFERDFVAGLRAAPVLVWVAATRPAHWRDWIAALRGA